MIKILKKLLPGDKLAEYYANNGEFEEAYQQYLKIGNHLKAGEILEKTEKWHEAANLYISKNETDRARKAIENCFIRDEGWEMFELENGDKLPIEDWLKQKKQARRFARYVKDLKINNNKGTPLIVVLANKLKHVLEYRSAAELYMNGFYMVNKEKESKTIKNEVWLRYAAECFTKEKLYKEAAQALKDLIVTEVEIGETILQNGYNPYRNYTHNLKLARDWNFLPQLVELLEDFDPFNIAYDLLKIGEPLLSMKIFFKYYGRVLKRELTDKERQIRNEKIQYCMNQYIIYYRNKKEYEKAAEIALLNSQKEIAAELYKKAEEEKEKIKAAQEMAVEEVKITAGTQPEEEEEVQKETLITPEKEKLKCPTCGEFVEPDWEVCPRCDNVLNLDMCECGQKIKPHWKRCPACQRILEPKVQSKEIIVVDSPDDDTKPFSILRPKS